MLIGGLNGAGKTTILEAMMVALYGRAYLGRRTPAREYERHVLSRIHRPRVGPNGGGGSRTASVGLSFRFRHAGSEDLYRVVRSWEAAPQGGGGGSAVSESLRVERNGAVLDDTDESQWQAFVEGLVPLGIARLFFFDGEKIVGAAEAAGGGSGGGGGAMRESLNVLLGAELIDRLSDDLDLYVARKAGGRGGGSGGSSGGKGLAHEQYEAMLAERDALVSGIESLREDMLSKEAQLDEAEVHVAEEESKIKGAGGGYADLRAGLLAERAAVEERLQGHERAIREALSGAAPLAMMPGLLGRAVSRVDEDLASMRSAAAAAEAAPKIDALRREMESDSFWPGGRADGAAADLIARRLGEMFRHEPGGAALFDVSEEEASAVRSAAAAAASFPPAPLRGEFDGHARAAARLRDVVEGLARAPSDDEMAARVRGIRDVHREIGMMRAEIEHVGQRLSAREANLKVVRNRLRRILDELRRDERADKGVALAGRMKAALEAYRKRLLGRKMRELEENLLAVASVLLHKGGVERIAVDPETLEVGAYEGGGGEPVPLMSMGEQQMIGTALLWAIAKTSGRPLPFVIDTPLGRLDGAHLSNLVDRFYPSASHQTVLLSTDREIGAAEYARLRPHVARAYVIEFDAGERRTAVREGYFGEDGGGGRGHAAEEGEGGVQA